MAMPEMVEEPSYGNRAWKVRKKLVVWERPLRKGEREGLGDAAPPERRADRRRPGARRGGQGGPRLASEPEIYFTTPHFDGHLSVLILLDKIPRADLEEAIVEAWLMQAPKRVAAGYLDGTVGAVR